jgi:tetratricopeptide (TPR) repeat protein
MAARGLLAEYYANEGLYMRAFGEANKLYGLLKNGMELVDEYPEFLFTAGLYNYFRVVYPERHPIYAPLMWFFMDGDKEKGLSQIHSATKNTILSQVESYVYLSYIYLRYEQQPEKALDLLHKLKSMYPTNVYVLTKFLEASYASHQYEKIDLKTIGSIGNSDAAYYQMAGNIFRGAYHEFNTGDSAAAYKYYEIGVTIGEEIASHGEYYKSIAYLGMARLKQEDDPISAVLFYELALEYAETDEVIKEAKNGLKK